MKKVTILMVFTVAIMFTSALLLSSNIHSAFAHQTKKFGNINVEVGWANEPSLAGQLNTVTVGITTASDNKPVANAVENLQATIKKGGDTKTLDLLPQEQVGLYGAQVIPTQIGQYQVVFSGTVKGQAIDGSIPLDDVADPNTINFPKTAGSSGSGAATAATGTTTTTNVQIPSNIMDQFRTAITGLTAQIDNATASASKAQQSAQSAAQTLQDVKASADRAYMFGMAGVGVGVAGIVIGVVALSRREKVEGEKISRF